MVEAEVATQEKNADGTTQEPNMADKEQGQSIASTESGVNRFLGKNLPVIGVGALALVGVTVATVTNVATADVIFSLYIGKKKF